VPIFSYSEDTEEVSLKTLVERFPSPVVTLSQLSGDRRVGKLDRVGGPGFGRVVRA
jgi:hypothetical protein